MFPFITRKKVSICSQFNLIDFWEKQLRNERDFVCVFYFPSGALSSQRSLFPWFLFTFFCSTTVSLGLCLSFFSFCLQDCISVCRAHKFGTSICLVKCRHMSSPSSLPSLLRSPGILGRLRTVTSDTHTR